MMKLILNQECNHQKLGFNHQKPGFHLDLMYIYIYLEIQINESLAKIIRNPKILSVSSKNRDLFFVVGVQTFPDGTIAVASATYSFLAVGFRNCCEVVLPFCFLDWLVTSLDD